MKEREMKDSGIPWIGEIPKDWSLIRIKNVASFLNGFAFNSETFKLESEIPVIRIGDIGTPLDYDSCVKVERDENLSSYLIRQDDILIAMSGATTGKSCIITQHNEAYINQRVGIIRSDMGKYILYTIQSPSFFEYVSLNIAGAAQPNISATEIGNFYIPFSNDKEQKAIAEFLNRKCGEIDELLTLQNKMIEELKAYKQSIITETVTKGLNPNVPLKDSGIKWIGEIPQHWEVKKLKYIVESIRKGNGITKDEVFSDGDISCVRYGEIYSKYNHGFKVCFSFTKEKLHKSPCYFYKGDILCAGTGELVEEIGKSIVYLGERQGLTGGDIILIRHNHAPSFLNYSLNSDFSQVQKSKGKAKLKVVHISAAEIGNIIMPLPPIREQQEIADYLDKKCSEIDSLIELKQKKIEELKEYKKSIIYEYVTGKKSVM